MLGYIAGVAFRDVLRGDSVKYCGNGEHQSVLLSVECVSPQHSLLKMNVDIPDPRVSLELKLAADDSFTGQ